MKIELNDNAALAVFTIMVFSLLILIVLAGAGVLHR